MQFDVNQELLRNWITKKSIIIKKNLSVISLIKKKENVN
jgi:hypothetical protein